MTRWTLSRPNIGYEPTGLENGGFSGTKLDCGTGEIGEFCGRRTLFINEKEEEFREEEEEEEEEVVVVVVVVVVVMAVEVGRRPAIALISTREEVLTFFKSLSVRSTMTRRIGCVGAGPK
jgi:hypothetical protein